MSAYTPVRPTTHCHACSRVIDAQAVVCTQCGVMQVSPEELFGSEKKILPAALLCFCFGIFGAHRFYAGKTGTAVLQLLTLGGLGIWMMVDLIMIIVGAFSDSDGNKLTEWT